MRDYVTPELSQQIDSAGSKRRFEEATLRLAATRGQFDDLAALSGRLGSLVSEGLENQLAELNAALAGFTTQITFVGQVKSGKTALVNALAGHPGLLPSDVNPWTSVVTTLHLNTMRPRNVRAEFAFFDQDEWEGLIREGGRLGSLAKRARADDELAQIRVQIEEMYQKSRQRLGRNFELLLGNRHKYDEFSQQLIERYVCLGDQYGGSEQEATQGRFADITRSADLYLEVGGYPMGLSLQDTPGVNDPFLMREQVTLRSMNSASLCVVVLSAAQAMNTVDLALVQLLTALESRRVLIFVNRIDELQDPVQDIPEIRQSLEQVLQARGMGDIGTIVFGSALWAEAALRGDRSCLPEDSHSSLDSLSQFDPSTEECPSAFAARAWMHCGIPDLLDAIGETVAATSGAQLIEESWRRLSNMIATLRTRQLAYAESAVSQLSEGTTRAKIDNLRRAVDSYLESDMGAQFDHFAQRVRQYSDDYVKRMAQDLLERARENGRVGVEICDPMQLRMRLRTAYIRYANELRSFFQEISDGTAQAMMDLFGQMLGEAASDMQLQPPAAPASPPPVALGRTIVVDLQTTRWKAWLAAHVNSRGLAREYHSLVEAEVSSISEELIATARQSLDEMASVLRGFLDEQEGYAIAIARGAPLGTFGAVNPLRSRKEALEELSRDLRRFSSQRDV
ncbi:dynamin family protein [Xinfangfangia sp. CPCC 101601]|uniref:Dynamin family protein n=1 Tax=Pseudogemmobacter lacusdianii TaxID=3069608 RepID=A0ABU0W267_9RHOB|nr:dynamin family protein [Xinfangfangia sp. CPCC 101601]MDQ2067873.1 dynamin family protein [Xinfangfangia sp. CPCC 101601]